jgi:hypothetical protein
MNSLRRILAMLLSIAALAQFARSVNACGPESIEPIFVFRDSPDLPFQEFTQGKIGILKPTFGRKTLTIAYRFLNGGVFNGEEQKMLVDALKGRAPEVDDEVVIKAWITARKTIIENERELPEIYSNRKNSGYDFFPNCTSNAFEVATETLKDRADRFGPQSVDVRDWLEGQDVVFRNCAEGSLMPKPVGSERPLWLRKDREYQTAAALFYSLHFDEARLRFTQIAQDNVSDWQQTADYLVARTLVRQASLESNKTEKQALYETAETYLHNLLPRATRFRVGSKKLLALVKYRLRPEERVRELAQTLTENSGNDNLGQDLIDYAWLLDKFDQEIQTAEAERQKQLNPPKSEVPGEAGNSDSNTSQRAEWEKNYGAVHRGELIQIWFYPRKADGAADYTAGGSFVFPPDASAADILQTVEAKYGRKLTPEEAKTLAEAHAQALDSRKFWLSPNRKVNYGGDYDGCSYHCNDITLDLLPNFLKADDLSDWIFTFPSDDPRAYGHALEKLRETQSPAWLVAALAKADKKSPSLSRLLTHAEKVQPDTPMFATIAYHRIRLYMELAQRSEALRLLDQMIATQFELLPVSAQNQLLKMRMDLAASRSEFLKFSTRIPVAFYKYGITGRISDILKVETEISDGETDAEAQKNFEKLLAWDKRVLFDPDTAEVLNWHFPTAQLFEVAHDSVLPDYLRTRILLAVWTRAVLLRNHELARKTAAEIVDKIPDASPLFQKYRRAITPTERDDAATFILLKWHNLSPYIAYGIDEVDRRSEGVDYYFELSWWCTLSETDYDEAGNEMPKRVNPPGFLTAESRAVASNERKDLIAIGDAKKYLGRKVLEWAKRNPKDTRLPEALFIAVKANESYKYGCGGWEQDEELRVELERILRERYAGSSWVAKLKEQDRHH